MQHHNKHSQHKKPVSLRALLNRLKEPLLQPPSLSPINDITMGGRSRSSSSDASDFKSIHNDLSKISSSTGHSDDSESEKNCREFGSDLSSPVPDPDCKTDSPETSQDGTDSDDGNNNTEEIVSDSGQDDDSDGPQNVSFLTLQLSSHLNQTHSLTQELESFRSQEGDLRRKRNAINADLFKVRKRQKIIDAQIEEREDSMRTERNTAGISEVLWDHYEAFCAALEPDGDPVRRSFAWNESYEDSYIKYDPMFGIFGSAVVDLHHCEARNWRCDCVATYTRDGDPIEYHVEYHPLAEFETMIWGDKFVGTEDNVSETQRTNMLSLANAL